MPSSIIAPWLKAPDTSQVIQSGAQIGATLHGQELEHQARMAAIAQQAAEAQMRANEAADRIGIEKQAQKDRNALAVSAAANIYQQQQSRQRAIQNGEDPIQAWLQYPGTHSGSVPSGAFDSAERTGRAQVPLQVVTDSNNPGRTIGVVDGSGAFHSIPIPHSSTVNSKQNPIDAETRRNLWKQYNDANKEINDPTFALKPPEMRTPALKAARAARESLIKFGVNLDGPTGSTDVVNGVDQPTPVTGYSTPPATAAPSPQKIAPGFIDPDTNLKYVGGSIRDKNSWIPVGKGSSFIGDPEGENQAAVPGEYGQEGEEDQD